MNSFSFDLYFHLFCCLMNISNIQHLQQRSHHIQTWKTTQKLCFSHCPLSKSCSKHYKILCSIFPPVYRLMQAPCSFKSAISWVQLKTNYMFLINNPGSHVQPAAICFSTSAALYPTSTFSPALVNDLVR